MKWLLLVTVLLSSGLTGFAQEKQTMRYNTTRDTEAEFTNRVIKYPQFLNGKAVMKNGSEVLALLNYNYGTDEVLFLSPKNDTLALDVPGLYSSIVIGMDTFVHSKQGYVQLVNNDPACKLFLKRKLDKVGWENKAAYGGYSSTSSTTPLKSISDGASMRSITTDENIMYMYKDVYFLVTVLTIFIRLLKKALVILPGRIQGL